MPWKVEQGHGCPASKPWAVVKQADGTVQGCHPTKQAAQKQQAALYAKEPSMASVNGTHPTGPLAVDVVRAMGRSPVLRDAHDGNGLGALEIRFSAFDVWYRVDSVWEGTFLERTIHGAFADTILEDRAAQRVLFDHGFDPQIGNKVLGPIMDLREDSDSPVAEVPLFDTSYNRDLVPGLRAGVYGSSFRMRVPKDGDSWDDRPRKSAHNPDGIPERTISKVRALEFGPVTFPANPNATAMVRSTTDEFYERLRQRDQTAYQEAARAAGLHLPDFTGRPGQRMAGGGDTDAEPGNGDASAIQEALHARDRAWRLRRRLTGV